MTLNCFYNTIGGDYDDVTKRLVSEEFASRMVVKFLKDGSFAALSSAMASRNIDEAFRAAHTLKGVAQNLGFTSLGKSAAELTEVLRARTFSGSDELYEKVKSDYDFLIAALKEFAES